MAVASRPARAAAHGGERFQFLPDLRQRFQPPFAAGTDADLVSRGLIAVSGLGLPWLGPPDLSELAAIVGDRLALAGLQRTDRSA